jgi:acyl-CoA synthetase (AMP-forming)/AMP-acid ligase II
LTKRDIGELRLAARAASPDMLIPIADVPRWYAERKPADTVAVRHGQDALSWQQLERGANARARAFAAKGVEAAVSAHPEVRSCVVVGLPDAEMGQRVHAILELDAATDAQKSPTA